MPSTARACASVVDPFARMRWSTRLLCLLANPKDMMDPGRAFKENPIEKARIEIDFEGVSMFGGEPVNEDGSPIEESAEKALRAATTSNTWPGASRSATSPGNWTASDCATTLGAALLAEHLLVPLAADELRARLRDDAVRRHRRGRIPAPGRYGAGERRVHPAPRSSIEAEYDADDCQTRMRCVAKSDARTYEVTGEVMPHPLRNRRTSPDGEAMTTRICGRHDALRMRRPGGLRTLRVPRPDRRRRAGGEAAGA